MRPIRTWWIRAGAAELVRYAPEQAPPDDDIETFLQSSKLGPRLLPLQTKRYVRRNARWAAAWLKAYIAHHVDSLRATYIGDGTSFYIALLEDPDTGDRSVAFRLTGSELPGYTQWTISVRRVRLNGSDEFFLCAE